VNELILLRMVTRDVALSPFLRLEWCRQQATKKGPEQKFAENVHRADSLFLVSEREGIAVSSPPAAISSGSKIAQPPAVALPTVPDAIDALLRTELQSARIVSDETELPATSGAALGCGMLNILGANEHFRLLCCSRG
jgi:hypothetical protein